MANEAVVVELYGENGSGDQRSFIVGNLAAVAKGALLKMLDPRTASGALTQKIVAPEIVAGIAAMDKTASDGSTRISVWTNGVFDLVASSAIGVGDAVGITTGNKVEALTALAAASGAYILGYAMETASDGERINVRVNL